MKTSGLPKSFIFEIPAYWTAEQALAVFELIDDIREKIWTHYGLKLQEEIQHQMSVNNMDSSDTSHIGRDTEF